MSIVSASNVYRFNSLKLVSASYSEIEAMNIIGITSINDFSIRMYLILQMIFSWLKGQNEKFTPAVREVATCRHNGVRLRAPLSSSAPNCHDVEGVFVDP